MQNSNILGKLTNNVEMEEFYDELENDIEIVSGAYHSISKMYKKGGKKFKQKRCFD